MHTSSSARSNSLRCASVKSPSPVHPVPMVQPGTIVLHRIPRLPYWVAMYLVSTIVPAFAAPYAAEPVAPANPLPDETLMIEPLPCSSMCGSTARQHRNWLVRHVRIVQSHASRLVPRRSVAAPGWTA